MTAEHIIDHVKDDYRVIAEVRDDGSIKLVREAWSGGAHGQWYALEYQDSPLSPRALVNLAELVKPAASDLMTERAARRALADHAAGNLTITTLQQTCADLRKELERVRRQSRAELSELTAEHERSIANLAPALASLTAEARNLLANALTAIDGGAPVELIDCAARAADVLGRWGPLMRDVDAAHGLTVSDFQPQLDRARETSDGPGRKR